MKYCAVICEYNPFHNGHLYQLNKAVSLGNFDGVICVMSGDFVQRAEPALVNKYVRAKCALLNGASLVIELPALYATGSGERFARGAVELVCALPGVSHLVMGCEADDEKHLKTLADIQYEEPPELKELLKKGMAEGLSYAQSYAEATGKIAVSRGISSDMSRIILSKPNNLLCLEYIKALKAHKSEIKPLIIKRKGDGYNSAYAVSATASATALRRMLKENPGAYESITQYVPDSVGRLLKGELELHRVNERTYGDIMMYNLKCLSPQDYSALPEISEGIEYRLMKAVSQTTDYYSLLEKVKTKRYTMNRLKRICLQTVLGIKSNTVSDITQSFAHILGVKEDFKYYLSELPENFYVQINDDEHMNSSKKTLLNIDKRAGMIYSMLTHNDEYSFNQRLITV